MRAVLLFIALPCFAGELSPEAQIALTSLREGERARVEAALGDATQLPLYRGDFTVDPAARTASGKVALTLSKVPARRELLLRNDFAVPSEVTVRALLDTGASVSGFSSRLFRSLDLTPVARSPVVTSSTRPDTPHECDFYDVSLAVVAGGTAVRFPDTRVMEADCWWPGEGFEALIGLDILTRCFFQLNGPEGWFTLAL